MSQVDEALRKLDSSGQVTCNAVHSLLSTLLKQHNDGEIDIPILLTKFSFISKQLETLWNDIDLERFSIVAPSPLKPISNPLNTPQLLFSALSNEDEGAIIKPQNKYLKLSDDETERKLSEVDDHNDSIQNILDSYQERVDDIKKELKRKQDEKNKEARIQMSKRIKI